MHAKIIQYNATSGAGIALAQGQQYDFTIRNWRSDSAPAVGQTIEITLENGAVIAAFVVSPDVEIHASSGRKASMAERSKIPVFKNDPVMVLVLGFVTCGLYFLYWNMQMAKVLNKVAGREAIPMPMAIFGGCCWVTNVVFYYFAGQTLSDVGVLIGKPEDLKGKSVLLLILGFLVPQVAAMILQGHVNEIYQPE